MINISDIFLALLGGVLPALLWLYFWLREDAANPEPRTKLTRTFLLGMLCVFLVLPGQKYVSSIIPGVTTLTFLLWALLEEVFKFGAAYFGGLRSKANNEPLDSLIYMLTAALGFVALENTLFILGPVVGNDFLGGFITGNLRFIGASLLHIVSSSVIGASLALTFGQSKLRRAPIVVLAVGMAVVIHAFFNVFISSESDSNIFLAFLGVWIGIAVLLLFFEKIKQLRARRSGL